MRRTVFGAVALAAGAIAIWLSSGGNSATETGIRSVSPPSAATISIWEMHNLAHLENLPVQHFEDQSLVFSQTER